MKHTRRLDAYTLLELLVVIGVVALMAGGIGLALRDGTPTVALQSAQGTVASLLTAAQSQAALAQNRTMLVVDADPSGVSFLRGIHIAVETTQNSGRWHLSGDITLPPGIYVVPGGATTVNGVSYVADDTTVSVWPARRRSTLQVVLPGAVPAGAGNPAGIYLSMTAPFTGLAATSMGGGDKFVLAAARRNTAGINFYNAELVRGIALSAYGVAILINDGPGFDF